MTRPGQRCPGRVAFGILFDEPETLPPLGVVEITLRAVVGCTFLLVFTPTAADTQDVKLQSDSVLIGSVCAALVMLDQLTKWLAELVPSWPIVDATRSRGQLFSGADPDMLWATPIALVASALVLMLAFGLHHAERLSWWAVGIVGAGVAGTVIDIIGFGSMRTWFAVGPTRWSLSLVCLIVAGPFLVSAMISLLRTPLEVETPIEAMGSVASRSGVSSVGDTV